MYDVEMMNAGRRPRTRSSAVERPGTSSTFSALNASTSSSVTSKALRKGGSRRSVSPAL